MDLGIMTHGYVDADGGRINTLSINDNPVRTLQIVCDDGRHADVRITPDMVQVLLDILHQEAGRYFVDEIGGQHFLVPADRRMDWYDYDRRLEETSEPEPLPDYVREIESLSHLEFGAPLEPFC